MFAELVGERWELGRGLPTAGGSVAGSAARLLLAPASLTTLALEN